MEIITYAILLMAGTGLVLGVVIGIFAKLFRVVSDPRVDLVVELLPGANCGGCGMAGCADFAKAVVTGEAAPSKCPVSSAEQVSAIAQALGIEAGAAFKQKAVVLCGGDREQTMRLASYNGVADCVSASLVGSGPKGCAYGCLGMGSCARKCPFGAIEMINSLAIIHKELCVGCGSCALVCPRNVIKLVPAEAEVHVYCNSPLKAPAKRQVCKVACIGCRKCQKVAPEKFLIDGFRAIVNYADSALPTQEDVVATGCPTGALLTAEEHLHIEKHDPEWSAEK
ncbi:MAG: RnfABCDGE type electron transport complex subunit B [Victivallales bacterium]|jgi:electron transport complex protein RnfB|nr:RnfABCDGE type electron transport complex subunit B [Victivallales bacterium]